MDNTAAPWGATTCTVVNDDNTRCGAPATWHVLDSYTATDGDAYTACPHHFERLAPTAKDWHPRAADCHMPGSRWRGFPHHPGTGHCYFPHNHDTHEYSEHPETITA